MSIRFKVILPYLVLTLIVAITGAYIVTRLVSSSLTERLSNQLLQAGRVVSDQMVQRELRHVEDARVIAFTVGVAEALQTGDEDRISTLAAPAVGGQEIESLLVFDAQGNESTHLIAQSSGEIMNVSQAGRAAQMPFVLDLLQEANPDSFPRRALEKDPVDGRYYYFTALPVAFEGQFAGVVVVGTSLNTLMPDLKSTALADVILYGEDSKSVASTLGTVNEQGLFQRTISIPDEFYQSVLTSQDVVLGENIEVNERWYRLAYGPLQMGNDRLGVFAVVLPLDLVVDASQTNRSNYVLISILATIAVVLLGYLIARLIVNPLSKLVQVSLAIARGDLSRRTGIRTRDEIGVLANTFDEMTDHLQQRTLELEKTNKVLEQMDRTKTRFIQVSAHELRTPLTIVQGYAQMIQAKTKENELLARYSNGIVEGTERMVEIIDNMLDVSRIETNQLGMVSANVPIEQVIEKVEATFQSPLGSRRISLITRDLKTLPEVWGDKDLLYKLFYHVVANAIKYTPDGGTIVISGCLVEDANAGSQVEIRIQDSGIGIDPQNHEFVFEKFYQTGEVLLHSSGKTKFKGGGPGLGLAIARGIVNAHGGRIWIESPGFDEIKNPGTTVFIRLPFHGQANENP